MTRLLRLFTAVVTCVLLASATAQAATLSVAWNSNTETDLAGYIVSYGTTAGGYTQTVDVGLNTSWTLTVSDSKTYFFAVQAYNTSGGRSAYSNEVSGAAGIVSDPPPPPPPAPAPGGGPAPPFGTLDTPVDNATGVTGAVPFTGWGLDDAGVASASLCRAAVAGEPAPTDARCGGAAQIFVGDASFVTGARPDVQALYPTYPNSTRAGWGFMVLTNMLPGQGNGPYTFYMYLSDSDNHTVLIGSRTITCSNASSTTPFGTIDTPTQGQTVSGSSFVNFGWVLTPTPKSIPTNGSTLSVFIDGINVGQPTYNNPRADIAALFPGYANTPGPVGYHTLNTTTLANGLHTIAWSVSDNQGSAAGIGSRYFTVANGSVTAASLTADAPANAGRSLMLDASPALMLPAHVRAAADASGSGALRDEINLAPLGADHIVGRRGWNLDAPYRRFRANAEGRVWVQSEELDRLELRLNSSVLEGQAQSPLDSAGDSQTGYVRVGDDLGPLPIGSRLDPSTGEFTWHPGVAFVGAYDFVFVRWAQGQAVARQEVRVVLNPKGSGHVGPQIVIDTPTSQQDVGQPFTVAGWAIDPDAEQGTGVDVVHVWAYPLTGADPVFAGAASVSGVRPDVAALFGDRFRTSGYGLTVQGLVPGNYDLAVFAWSTATNGFVPAKVVRVTVR